jgi:hypothetical protein
VRFLEIAHFEEDEAKTSYGGKDWIYVAAAGTADLRSALWNDRWQSVANERAELIRPSFRQRGKYPAF